MNIAEQYEQGLINGWAGPELAKAEFDMLKNDPTFVKLSLSMPHGAEQKMFLHKLVRKVIGKDTDNYAQQVGDCTSFMGKNGGEYLQCCEIALLGDREVFKPLFPPYVYGTSRVNIGGGRISRDGGLGPWTAKALVEYGQIVKNENDCPEYSGSLARNWGSKGVPQKFIEFGKKHVIKSAAQIRSWDECVAAITNGYPVGVCSNRGFSMAPNADGFHTPTGTWNHAMTIIGVDNTYKTPFGIILNSWGNVMGKLKDFDTGEDLPVGCIRAKASVINAMLAQNDSFAYSNFQGFPEQFQEIQKALFKMN